MAHFAPTKLKNGLTLYLAPMAGTAAATPKTSNPVKNPMTLLGFMIG